MTGSKYYTDKKDVTKLYIEAKFIEMRLTF